MISTGSGVCRGQRKPLFGRKVGTCTYITVGRRINVIDMHSLRYLYILDTKTPILSAIFHNLGSRTNSTMRSCNIKTNTQKETNKKRKKGWRTHQENRIVDLPILYSFLVVARWPTRNFPNETDNKKVPVLFSFHNPLNPFTQSLHPDPHGLASRAQRLAPPLSWAHGHSTGCTGTIP